MIASSTKDEAAQDEQPRPETPVCWSDRPELVLQAPCTPWQGVVEVMRP
jgi:hypothetical protein